MKFLAVALLSVASVAGASAPQPAKVLLTCKNSMFDVAVTQELRGSLSKITISMRDISDHGRDYSFVTASNSVVRDLMNGVEGVSTEDTLGQPTGSVTGRETFKLSGTHAKLDGEIRAKVRCQSAL